MFAYYFKMKNKKNIVINTVPYRMNIITVPMKPTLFYFLLFTVFITMSSCSSDSAAQPTDAKQSTFIDENYVYSALELEELKLINEYRASIGLNTLEKINFISNRAEEHDNYMISKNTISHDGFVARAENIVKVVGAKSVSENLAYNFDTAKEALTAWLNSPTHKETIEGNFTHFGIAIRANPATGKKYYTNIFVKI